MVSFWLLKTKETNFDPAKAIKKLKIISLSCSLLTKRSETVQYMSTPEQYNYKQRGVDCRERKREKGKKIRDESEGNCTEMIRMQ